MASICSSLCIEEGRYAELKAFCYTRDLTEDSVDYINAAWDYSQTEKEFKALALLYTTRWIEVTRSRKEVYVRPCHEIVEGRDYFEGLQNEHNS